MRAVILANNPPPTFYDLYRVISEEFEVTVLNVGKPLKIPFYKNVKNRGTLNLWWFGVDNCQEEPVWLMSDDMLPLNSGREYRIAMERARPYDIWSPRVTGKGWPVMSAFSDKIVPVMTVEKHCPVVHPRVWHYIEEFIKTEFQNPGRKGLSFCWGLEFLWAWLVERQRLKVVLDSTVAMHHVREERTYEPRPWECNGPLFRSIMKQYSYARVFLNEPNLSAEVARRFQLH